MFVLEEETERKKRRKRRRKKKTVKNSQTRAECPHPIDII